MLEKEEVDETNFFVFVTPLPIDENCLLTELSKNNSNRSAVVDTLLKEAKRVASKRELAQRKKEVLHYKTRWPGCCITTMNSHQSLQYIHGGLL
ncbi:hypothetical protein P5663_20635 [Priestia flexa]|uniref:hypothetical protein n=1 Tax=Priestia flexa TaxID=86664 RepID=UPI00240D438B|nr:hypothetical protein [Priestia flexa]WEZ08378.1 hypothetical protein P5663_20635 [Priestia flexa]